MLNVSWDNADTSMSRSLGLCSRSNSKHKGTNTFQLLTQIHILSIKLSRKT